VFLCFDFAFLFLHLETAFSARTSIFSPHHFVVLRRDFILAPRCARAILKNSNLHILHHTYSVTDKNNIQDFVLEFSCVISRPLHPPSPPEFGLGAPQNVFLCVTERRFLFQASVVFVSVIRNCVMKRLCHFVWAASCPFKIF
jgi:hypothetical protein